MSSQVPISKDASSERDSAPQSTRSSRLRESWRWFSRLSLLEPLVAVAWHASFSHALGRRLPTPKGVLLFNSLWLVYAADRLLDVHNLPHQTEPQTERHRFAYRFTRGLSGAWVVVCLATIVQAYAVLTLKEWRGCLYLLAGTTVYLAALHWNKSSQKWLMSGAKEMAITALFTFGCTLFLWSNGRFTSDLWVPNLLFAGLVLQNLVTLAHLERHIDQAHQSVSIFQGGHSSRLHASIAVSVSLAALTALTLGLLQPELTATWLSERTRPLLVGIILSSSLLGGLASAAAKLKATNFDKLHLLADAAVLAGTFPLFTTSGG